MNEQNLDTSLEYIKKLPQSVRDVVYAGVWEERTEEIAKKYSLNERQADDLVNNVLYVLVGLSKPDDFIETVVSELGISGLLAEQIMDDLEVRVFEYAFKMIQNQDKKSESSDKTDDILPELRPDITPLVEPEEKVSATPIPVAFKSAVPKPAPEPVQRPVSVPRYTGVPVEDEESAPTATKSESPDSKQKEPVPEPVKKYVVDPYREPLE